MNKKADEKLLSIWFFIILALIGVIIVIGVSMYYSAENDIRAIEAISLYNKIVNAIVDNGNLKAEVLTKDYDIFNSAGINKNLFTDDGDYYFRIEINNKNSGNLERKPIVYGNKADFEVNCYLSGNKKFPGCYEKTFYVLSNNKELKVHILTGSKNEKHE